MLDQVALGSIPVVGRPLCPEPSTSLFLGRKPLIRVVVGCQDVVQALDHLHVGLGTAGGHAVGQMQLMETD